jgi:chemotaxis protein CheX
MMATQLKAEDIKVFSDAATAFFKASTGSQALVRTAYILETSASGVESDLQGLISISGKYRGLVAFSASRGLLSHVLLKMGESDYSEASHRDIVGEIANQMSGYARRHFGEAMHIAPPRVLSAPQTADASFAGSSFVIPMLWDGYEAQLLIQMQAA